MHGNRNSLVGQTFNRLTVLEDAGSDVKGNAISLVQCTCGNVKIVANRRLVSGDTKSCGCLQKEKAGLGFKEYWRGYTKKVYPPKRSSRGRPPIAKEIRDNVAEAIKAGLTYRLIAEIYSINIGTISNISKEYGIVTKRGRTYKGE